MKGELLFYPCYFDATLSRREGRRVPRSRGVPKPGLSDLEQAVRRLGLPSRRDTRSHPAHWFERGGCLVISTGLSKATLIKQIASRLEVHTERRK